MSVWLVIQCPKFVFELHQRFFAITRQRQVDLASVVTPVKRYLAVLLVFPIVLCVLIAHIFGTKTPHDQRETHRALLILPTA